MTHEPASPDVHPFARPLVGHSPTVAWLEVAVVPKWLMNSWFAARHCGA